VCRMVLKHDSEKETAFLLFVSEGLSQLNFSFLDSTTSLDLLSKTSLPTAGTLIPRRTLLLLSLRSGGTTSAKLY